MPKFSPPETEVAAAKEAAVVRKFDGCCDGGRDHVLRGSMAPEFVDSFTEIRESWPGGAS